MEYVSHVLPALGEDAVEQRAVGELVDGVVPDLRDPPAGRRAEGGPAARRGDRAAPPSCGSRPQPEELVLRLEGSFISVREREVRELLDAAREPSSAPTAAARERFRMSLLRRVLRGVRPRRSARARSATSTRSSRRSARSGYLDRVLKAAWPVVAPDRLVRRLLTSRAALADAADGILDAAEQRLLQRRGSGLVGRRRRRSSTRRARCSTTPPHAYGHVIVDEAQDLTPMQLRMVARRARDGALTILGDVAQATGAVRYSQLGRGAAAPAARRRGGRRGAAPRLPRAARDHGARAAAARHDRARRRPADLLPHRRRAAAHPRESTQEHLLAEALHEARAARRSRRPARRDRPRRAGRRASRPAISGTACRC